MNQTTLAEELALEADIDVLRQLVMLAQGQPAGLDSMTEQAYRLSSEIKLESFIDVMTTLDEYDRLKALGVIDSCQEN